MPFVLEADSWSTFSVALDELEHSAVTDEPLLDRSALYSIEFTFEGQGEFDLWLDDIALIPCAEP